MEMDNFIVVNNDNLNVIGGYNLDLWGVVERCFFGGQVFFFLFLVYWCIDSLSSVYVIHITLTTPN